MPAAAPGTATSGAAAHGAAGPADAADAAEGSANATQRANPNYPGAGRVNPNYPGAGRGNPSYPGAGRANPNYPGGGPGGRTFGPNQRGPGAGRPGGYRTGLRQPQRSGSGRVYVYRGRSFHPYVVGRYRWPRGYDYRRYAVGWRLPFMFLIPDFFINDYYDYGVAPPPAGYQWVRYGPDMLLVDLQSGQVVDAVYGAFEESDQVQDMPPDAPYPDNAPYPDDPNAPPPQPQ